MAFEAPTDNYDPDKYDGPAAGNYHMQLVFVDEDGGKHGEMICDFEVLAGSTPGQEGKTHREYFQKTVKSFGRIHALAVALGMVTNDELKALKAAGKSPIYDFAAQVGKQLCVGLVDEEYNGRSRVKANFALYHVAAEKVASWPKNAVMLARAGIVLAPPAPKPAAPAAANLLPGL